MDGEINCPVCGSTTIEMLYGMPTPEAFEAAERGELQLGGCMVFNEQPDRICTGSPRHLLLNGKFLGTEDDADEDEEPEDGERLTSIPATPPAMG